MFRGLVPPLHLMGNFVMTSPAETLSVKLREDPFFCEFSPSEQEILDAERKAHSKRARRIEELLRTLHYLETSEPHRENKHTGWTEDQFWHSYGDRHSGYEIPKLEAALAQRMKELTSERHFISADAVRTTCVLCAHPFACTCGLDAL